MILSQASETGGKYIFSEKLDLDFEQILTSTIRDNAAALRFYDRMGWRPTQLMCWRR